MSVARIAKRYAQSLHDFALEQEKHDTIHADMKLVEKTAHTSRDFYLMLQSPIIREDTKGKILQAIFDNKVDQITLNFIKIVVDKGREAHLVEIAKAFIELYNEYNHITPVKVTTAVELSDDMYQKIRQALINKTYIEKVEMSTAVKEDIIGGFVLHFEDKLYDASVVHKLNQIKKELTN